MGDAIGRPVLAEGVVHGKVGSRRSIWLADWRSHDERRRVREHRAAGHLAIHGGRRRWREERPSLRRVGLDRGGLAPRSVRGGGHEHHRRIATGVGRIGRAPGDTDSDLGQGTGAHAELRRDLALRRWRRRQPDQGLDARELREVHDAHRRQRAQARGEQLRPSSGAGPGLAADDPATIGAKRVQKQSRHPAAVARSCRLLRSHERRRGGALAEPPLAERVA
mmetsp:Transcript_19495/g.56688  ORF Transcript_19495/g.56688 Transcript_19495/m.56688 type:complete len:222 (+) Transcript_19495:334-999(+)